MITLRDANLPDDADAIRALDRSFTTDRAFVPFRFGDQFNLRQLPLAEPVTKTFPLDDLASPSRPWRFAVVAQASEKIAGFVAAGYSEWNRRLTIWHFYVDAPSRRQGIGRRLIERVTGAARERGALNLWLETSNLNVPGIKAYRRLGFELCGLDTTLYQGTPAQGETALFFARPL